MKSFQAPAKVNLSLLVSPPRSDGYHPLESLVQTVAWCDVLDVEVGEAKDEMESDLENNLVIRAVEVARQLGKVPPLTLRLHKSIPVAAGLGGGSSDAAAALLATSELGEVRADLLAQAASRVGADVSLFLTGGTLMMSGLGEEIEKAKPAHGFALAIVVPGYGLSTADVYRRWDELEGPEGDVVDDRLLPPSLRGRMPMRNDLLPAAISLEPRLGDFMTDVAAVWGGGVCLTGSGSACFGYFPTLGEAADAADAVTSLSHEGRGVTLRDRGVSVIQPDT